MDKKRETKDAKNSTETIVSILRILLLWSIIMMFTKIAITQPKLQNTPSTKLIEHINDSSIFDAAP